MEFNLERSMEILSRTPEVLNELLRDLPDEWILSSEGDSTWSPFDIVGHLIHGEKTDWVARMEIILSDDLNKSFEPYDRFAQFKESEGKRMNELLDEFSERRKQNLEILQNKNLAEADFLRQGIHPKFGLVTLSQLLSTWVVHDLNHIAQVTRVMAKQYKAEVGPWIQYLKILSI